jgi:hypothetical protein
LSTDISLVPIISRKNQMTSMASAMKNAALAAAALLASAGTIFYDHGTGAQAAKPAALTHSVPGHITE